MAKTTGSPFYDFDVSKLFAEYKVPGVDVDAILAAQRKNIEAVTAANQTAMEAFQAVMRRQTEIMQQSIEEAGRMVNELTAPASPEDKAAKQAELVKAAFEKALANAKELSEMIAKSNTEAGEIIAKRVSESLDELKAAIAKAKK